MLDKAKEWIAFWALPKYETGKVPTVKSQQDEVAMVRWLVDNLEGAQAEIARLRESIEAAGILLKLMWDRSEDWAGSRPSSHVRSDIHDLILRFLADATALKEGE